MCKVGAFVGGAIAGAAVALLLAPVKGEDMRMRIKDVLKKYGVLACNNCADNVDHIAAELASEIKKI